jgi:hypothetical protein
MPEENEEITIDKGFFKHVFNFSESNKAFMLNMIQYTVLAFIPVILVLKVTKTYVPEADEKKGSVELLAESLFQVIFIVLSFWFINRIITFIPTYSGKPYKEFNETTFIVGFIFILLTLQTKLGEKISILTDRVMDLVNGDASLNDNKQKQGNVRVKQPFSTIAQGNADMNMQNIQNIQSMMPAPVMTNHKAVTNEYSLNSMNMPSKQQYPDYNSMHQGPETPLPNSMHPGYNEPVAANAFGGGGFGSAW